MLITIYDSTGTSKAELSPNDSSTQVKEIQGDSILTLSFTHYDHISLDVDDYVDFEGERFWLTEKYRPRQNAQKEWVYDIKLYGVESMLKRLLVIKTVDDEDDPIFTLTAPPREHVAMIVRCMNNGLGNITDWKVGQVDGIENIVIDYFGKYCDEALKEIAEKVGAEAWVEGQTVNICKCEHGEPIPMGYDKGLLSIDPGTADNVKFYTRLYPVGSSRNIDRGKYGYSRLQLPGGQKYVEINADKYGRVDHYEADAFADIYPRRTGIVSNVRSEVKTGEDGNPFTIYYFSDNSLPFDPNAYEIGGLVKRVSFQEGSELAGLGEEDNGTYFFEVNFNSSTREFEIITIWPYDNDMQLPGDKLIPKIGDKYILWNLRMPDEYYELAEAEFMSAVNKYNADHNLDISVYKAPTDHVWIEDNEVVLTIGQRVRLESDEYFPETGYRDSRITKITRKVNLPSSMDIEISDALSRTSQEKMSESIADVRSYARSISESINLPDVIRTGDNTFPTDNNLFSAKRTLTEFLSKRKDDRSAGKITSDKGFDVGDFLAGVAGGRFAKDAETGQTFLEVDRIYARVKAFFETLVMMESSTMAGKVYITPGGSIKCTKVEEIKDASDNVTAYRCYFLSEQDGEKTETKMIAGDQTISEMFNAAPGTSNKVSNHRYWRLVTAVSNDAYSDEQGNHYGYIDLSKADCEAGSDVPKAGDVIDQFGSHTDASRRAAMIFSTVDEDAPSIKLLTGIGDGSTLAERYSLEGHNIIAYGYDPVEGNAYFQCYGDHYVGAPDGSTGIQYKAKDKSFELSNVTQRVTAEIDGVKTVLVGMNGTYSPLLGGKTIGSWWGGSMVDKFYDEDGYLRQTPLLSGCATSLVRMDGSAYWANGNIRWDKNGLVTFGNGIKIDLGDGKDTTLGGLSNTITTMFDLVNGMANNFIPMTRDADGKETPTTWDAISRGTKQLYAVKSIEGFYSEKFLSTRGTSDGSAGGGGGIDEEWLIDNNYATQPWVESKGYITAAALSDYATREWVNSQGFLKNHQSLANYVTLDTAQTITGAKTFALSSVNQLTLRRTAQAGGAFIDYYANNSTVDFWRAGMTSDKDFGFAWHDSLTNAKIDSAGNIYATAFKRVGGTSNQVLMADGGVMTKVSANAVTDSGWASGEIDSKRIPDMSFIAYWNGRYNATSSNLAYCNKGAFGDIVTQSQSSLDDRYVNVSGDTMTGPLFFGNANCKIHNVYDMLVVATNDGTDRVVINSTEFRRSAATPTYNLGSSEYRWANVYANTINVSSTGLVSNLNADLLDGLHCTAFARADQSSAVDLNTVGGIGIMSNPRNADAIAERHYPLAEAGCLIYCTAAYSSANQIYGTYNTNRWFARGGGAGVSSKTSWREFAFTDSNVASATNADMLDGIHASGFMRSEFAGSIDFNQMTVSGVYRYSDNNTNGPSGDWGQLLVLHGGGDTIAQMAFDYSDSGFVEIRSGNPLKSNGSWGGWNRLARITDNVYSATRLRDTFTLWGQSFYGNNVSGDMTGVGSISASGLISTSENFKSTRDGSNFLIERGGLTAMFGINAGLGGAYLWTNSNHHLRFGTNNTERMRITEGGNVGIGTSSPSYPLDVNGNAIVRGWLRTTGENGWYSETFGGGWYMKDSVWIRVWSNKGLYMGTGTIRTDGQIQVGMEGSAFLVDSGGAVSAAGRVTAYGGVTVPKSKSIILGNAEIYQRSDDCLTFWGGASGELYYCEFEGDIRPYNNGTGYIGSFDNYWDAVFSYSINSLRLRVYSDLDNVNTNYGELLWDNTNKAIYTKQGFYSTQWIATKGAAETSDMRLKRVLAPVELSVAQMAAAPLFLFEWRDGEPGVFVGSSAQYWEKVLPQLVMKLGGNRQLFYGQLGVVAGIVNSRAIERLTTRHDRWLGRHETRIQRLERENRELRKRIDELEKNDSLICHTRTEKYITRP